MDVTLAGILAIVIGYLLGSIPSAYIAGRIVTGKDIRNMGGGNIGGLNTVREVGLGPGIAVIIFDIGKGAAAVAIAWLFDVPPLFVLLSGLAAVIGHLWMVWLRFSGGRGLGAAFGATAAAMFIYGLVLQLIVLVILLAVSLLILRRITISSAIALLFLPLLVWWGSGSLMAMGLSVLMAGIVGAKFLPTARKDWRNRKRKAVPEAADVKKQG